ncbi:MAG: C45 family autoproteolytic acyltransferase/hydrolase [Trueperaceae bacterium]
MLEKGTDMQRRLARQLKDFEADLAARGESLQTAVEEGAIRSRLWTRFLPNVEQELRRTAAATNVDFDVLGAFALARDGVAGADGCSNFLALGESTESGRPILHKTMDYCRTFYGTWRLVRPKNGHKYIASSILGEPAANMGLNEKGVTLGSSGSISTEQNRRGVPHRIMATHLLEKASSIRDIPDMMMAVPRATGFNMMFTDPSGNGLIVEGTAYRLWHEFVRDQVLVRTNHFHALTEYQDREKGELAIMQSSIPRYSVASRVLKEQFGHIDVGTITELTRSHEGIKEGLPWGGSICVHGAMWSSMSAGTFEVSDTHTDVLSKVWASVGYKCSSVFFPLYIGMEEIPEAFETGALADLADRLAALVPKESVSNLIEQIEGGLKAEAAEAERTAEQLLDEGSRSAAVNLLTEFAFRVTVDAMRAMESLIDQFQGESASTGPLCVRAPSEIYFDTRRGDRMLRFQVVNIGPSEIEMVAAIEGVDDSALLRFPHRVVVAPGSCTSGLLLMSPEWKPRQTRLPVTLVLREHPSEAILSRSPMVLNSGEPELDQWELA